MSKEHETFPTQAGLDTTTGRGADLVFSTENLSDPYATRCLRAFVDTVINHKQVVCPLPSRAIAEKPEEWLLPLSFVEANKRGLLTVKTDVSADEVRLPAEVLASEYQNFTTWAKQSATELAGWLEYYQNPTHAHLRSIVVPKYLVHRFWATHRDDKLGDQLGISDSELEFAFDFFVRGIKYHQMLGETVPFFPHPAREHAFGHLPVRLQRQNQWSWGEYFVQLYNEEKAPRDIGWLLDKMSSIHRLAQKYSATWYTLNQQPKNQQIELLSTIASEANLPAKLKESTRKAIAAALGVGGVFAFSIPIVSMVLELGVVAVELWRGDVPGGLGRIPIFKGHLVWPGLTHQHDRN